jgi:hypothetical protein
VASSITLRFAVGGRYAVLTLHGSGEAGAEGAGDEGANRGGGAAAAAEDGMLARWAEEDCGRRLAEADVRRLLTHEDVPPYLELPLLSALDSLHREEVRPA